MNRQARTLVLPLVIALAFAVVQPMMMSGQVDTEEMVFERPTVVQNSSTIIPPVALPAVPKKTVPVNAVQSPKTTLPAQKPAGKASLPGKTTVSQPTNKLPSKNYRFPVPATEVNQPIPTRQSVTNNSGLSSPVVQAAAVSKDPKDSNVTRVAHVDPMQGVTPDGGDPLQPPQSRRQAMKTPPLITSPASRAVPPRAMGVLMNLNGETAVERCLQLQTAMSELERENEELRQQNTGLTSRVKESHDQLNTAVREIQLARKELTSARTDLDRLRNEVQTLRDKIRVAEREYSTVLQSMGPLLQQLLEADDVSSLPPNPAE